MLVILLGFSAALYSGHRAMPMPWYALTVFGVLLGIGMVSQLATLVSARPLLEIDGTGIQYYRRWYGLIRWEDVVGIERLPLTTKTDEGTHTYIKDGWRPIRVVVKNREAYLTKVPGVLRMGFIAGQAPDCAAILIEFTGLQPRSAKAFECIKYYAVQCGARVTGDNDGGLS